MNAEIYAEWYRRQGYRVIHSNSSYWYEASRGAFQAFPFHWLIKPSEKELKSIFKNKWAFAARYSTPLDSSYGSVSYHAVYDAPAYSLDLLDRRSRQNIRAGLQNCRVEQIPLLQLAEDGWQLELDTTTRQDRKIAYTKEQWFRRYQSAADLPGFEAWGALVGDRLVASILAFIVDDCCELISQQCHHDFLPAKVNNALTYTITQEMISRPGVHSIFYTLQSLDAPPSVDDFKFRMGYSARKLRQRVVFHPLIQHAIQPFSYQVFTQLRRFFPESSFVSKTDGMMRFYLNGQLPLEKQNWPECLQKEKPQNTIIEPQAS